MEQSLDSFINEWIGVPFKHMGRSMEGVDCLGLVIARFGWLGIDVPRYRPNWVSEGKNYFWDALKTGTNVWVKIESPKGNDIVLFEDGGIIFHVGIVIDNERFIHAEENKGVIVRRYRAFGKKIHAYYRYKV